MTTACRRTGAYISSTLPAIGTVGTHTGAPARDARSYIATPGLHAITGRYTQVGERCSVPRPRLFSAISAAPEHRGAVGAYDVDSPSA